MVVNFDNGTSVDVKYIYCDIEPRYLEDAKIKLPDNNKFVQDISFEEQREGKDSMMPLMHHFGDEYHWIFKIDVDNGCILNWVKGVEADVYYKVCDQGGYTFYNENNDEILDYDGYVPNILSIDDEGWGDYVSMTIDGDGNIVEWKENIELVREALKKDLLKHGYKTQE